MADLRGKQYYTGPTPLVAQPEIPTLTADEVRAQRMGDFRRGVVGTEIGLRAGNLYAEADNALNAGQPERAAELEQQAKSLDQESSAYATRVPSISNVHDPLDLVDYIQGGAGSLLPTMAAPMIAGGVGGIAGAAIGTAIAGPAGTVPGAYLGASLSASVPAFNMESSEQASAQHHDRTIMDTTTAQERIDARRSKATINAALESIFPAVFSGRIIGGVAKEVGEKAVKEASKKAIGRTVTKEFAIESGTETSQTLSGQHFQSKLNPERDTSGDVVELIDSAILGGLGGGGISLASVTPGYMLDKIIKGDGNETINPKSDKQPPGGFIPSTQTEDLTGKNPSKADKGFIPVKKDIGAAIQRLNDPEFIAFTHFGDKQQTADTGPQQTWSEAQKDSIYKNALARITKVDMEIAELEKSGRKSKTLARKKKLRADLENLGASLLRDISPGAIAAFKNSEEGQSIINEAEAQDEKVRSLNIFVAKGGTAKILKRGISRNKVLDHLQKLVNEDIITKEEAFAAKATPLGDAIMERGSMQDMQNYASDMLRDFDARIKSGTNSLIKERNLLEAAKKSKNEKRLQSALNEYVDIKGPANFTPTDRGMQSVSKNMTASPEETKRLQEKEAIRVLRTDGKIHTVFKKDLKREGSKRFGWDKNNMLEALSADPGFVAVVDKNGNRATSKTIYEALQLKRPKSKKKYPAKRTGYSAKVKIKKLEEQLINAKNKGEIRKKIRSEQRVIDNLAYESDGSVQDSEANRRALRTEIANLQKKANAGDRKVLKRLNNRLEALHTTFTDKGEQTTTKSGRNLTEDPEAAAQTNDSKIFGHILNNLQNMRRVRRLEESVSELKTLAGKTKPAFKKNLVEAKLRTEEKNLKNALKEVERGKYDEYSLQSTYVPITPTRSDVLAGEDNRQRVKSLSKEIAALNKERRKAGTVKAPIDAKLKVLKDERQKLLDARKPIAKKAEETSSTATAKKPAKYKLGTVRLKKQGPYTAKDQRKSDKANKFIGQGSENSSTNSYRKDWGKRANSGRYTSEDTVFVSVEGNRRGRLGLNVTEVKKAIAAGVTFIADNANDRSRPYNIGERQLAQVLSSNGYVESKGVWTKATKSALQDEPKTTSKALGTQTLNTKIVPKELTAKLEKASVLVPIQSDGFKHTQNLCLGTCKIVLGRLKKVFPDDDIAKINMTSLVRNKDGSLRQSKKKDGNQTINHHAAAVRFKGIWYLVDQPQTEFSYAKNDNSNSLTMESAYTPRIIPTRDIPTLYGPQKPFSMFPVLGGRGFSIPIKQMLNEWGVWISSIYNSGINDRLNQLNGRSSPITGGKVHAFVQRLEQKLLDNGISKAEIKAKIPGQVAVPSVPMMNMHKRAMAKIANMTSQQLNIARLATQKAANTTANAAFKALKIKELAAIEARLLLETNSGKVTSIRSKVDARLRDSIKHEKPFLTASIPLDQEAIEAMKQVIADNEIGKGLLTKKEFEIYKLQYEFIVKNLFGIQQYQKHHLGKESKYKFLFEQNLTAKGLMKAVEAMLLDRLEIFGVDLTAKPELELVTKLKDHVLNTRDKDGKRVQHLNGAAAKDFIEKRFKKYAHLIDFADSRPSHIPSNVLGQHQGTVGRVRIFTDGFESEETYTWFTWHELFHKGVSVLRNADKKDIKSLFTQMHKEIPLIQKIVGSKHLKQNYSDIDFIAQVEEAFVEVAAAVKTSKGLKQLETKYDLKLTKIEQSKLQIFVSKLRTALRKMVGLKPTYSEEITAKVDNKLLKMIAMTEKAINKGHTVNPSMSKEFWSLYDAYKNAVHSDPKTLKEVKALNALNAFAEKMNRVPSTSLAEKAADGKRSSSKFNVKNAIKTQGFIPFQNQTGLSQKDSEAVIRKHFSKYMEFIDLVPTAGVSNRVAGQYSSFSRRVRVFTGHKDSENELVWVTWHELFHKGIATLGKDKRIYLKRIYENNPLIKEMIGSENMASYSSLELLARVEEAFVEIAAAMKTKNGYKQLEDLYGVKLTAQKRSKLRVWLDDVIRFLSDLVGLPVTEETLIPKDIAALVKKAEKGISEKSVISKKDGIISWELMDDYLMFRQGLENNTYGNDTQLAKEAIADIEKRLNKFAAANGFKVKSSIRHLPPRAAEISRTRRTQYKNMRVAQLNREIKKLESKLERFKKNPTVVKALKQQLEAARAEHARKDAARIKAKEKLQFSNQKQDGYRRGTFTTVGKARKGNKALDAEAKRGEELVKKMLGDLLDGPIQWFLHKGTKRKAYGAYGSKIKGKTSDNKKIEGKFIRAAIDAMNPLSILFHESMHALATEMANLKEGRVQYEKIAKLAMSPHIQMQLRKLLKGSPKAIKQLEDPNESVAYMFQFWATRETTGFRIQPLARNVFKTWAEAFAQLVGYITKTQAAEEIFTAFQTGDMSTIAGIQDTLASVQHKKAMAALTTVASPVRETVTQLFQTPVRRLKNTNISSLVTLANKYFADAKTGGALGVIQMIAQQHGKWLNRFENILQSNKASSKEVQRSLRRLQAGETKTKLDKQIRKLFEDLYEYATTGKNPVTVLVKDKNGRPVSAKLGYTPNFFPRVWSTEAILDQSEKLRKLLKEESAAAGEPLNDKEIDNFIDAVRSGDGITDIGKTNSSLTPAFASSNVRTFSFITEKNAHKFVEFQEQDMHKIVSRYIRQIVHRREHSRAFGSDGQGVQRLINAAKKAGASAKQIEMAYKAVEAMDGTLGTDKVSTLARNTMVTAMTAVNFAVLPLALFSSLVDPLGVLVRTGSLKSAAKTYQSSVQQLYNDTKGVKGNGQILAEYLGVIESETMLEVIGNTSNGMFMNQTLQKANAFFFKVIGLEQWTRGTRIGALNASLLYLRDNASDSEILKELNLQPGDIQATGDGKSIQVTEIKDEQRRQRVEQALFRMVDESILRPSSASRPIWMSDMRFILLGHLKQFTFSFHNTINRQVLHNFKKEQASGKNIASAALVGWPLLSYVPVMMAADMLRNIVAGRSYDDDDDDSFVKLVYQEIQRSGILGLGNFILDAQRDYKYGKLPINTVAGPTIAKAYDLARTAVNPNADFTHSLATLMPGAALWKGWLE